MKLYHGTTCDFEKIDFMKSKPNKDFGRGFYLSANYEQALNMANIKCEQMDYGKPVVQEYICFYFASYFIFIRLLQMFFLFLQRIFIIRL